MSAEGLRALYMHAAGLQDQVERLGGHTSPKAQELSALSDLLLPLVKGYGSERVYELLAVSLQCYGGAGYVRDFPIEQYIRDQKIDTLYEGTTHIQALDLFFRKIARDGGQILRRHLGRAQQTLAEERGGDALAAEREALGRALADVQGIFGAMMKKLPESLYHAGLQGNRILMALGEVTVAWLLVDQAALALTALSEPEPATGKDRAFYEGKVASARFFCAEVLPHVTAARKIIERGDLALMELDDAAFG